MASRSTAGTPSIPAEPRPQGPVQLSPERATNLREALEQSCRDEGRALTADELRRLAETGEWPES
jgi:hypothetical protein